MTIIKRCTSGYPFVKRHCLFFQINSFRCPQSLRTPGASQGLHESFQDPWSLPGLCQSSPSVLPEASWSLQETIPMPQHIPMPGTNTNTKQYPWQRQIGMQIYASGTSPSSFERVHMVSGCLLSCQGAYSGSLLMQPWVSIGIDLNNIYYHYITLNIRLACRVLISICNITRCCVRTCCRFRGIVSLNTHLSFDK
jgi:hypothetical protein